MSYFPPVTKQVTKDFTFVKGISQDSKEAINGLISQGYEPYGNPIVVDGEVVTFFILKQTVKV